MAKRGRKPRTKRACQRGATQLAGIATLLPGLVGAVTLGHVVEAKDNLFHEDWGHGFTGVIDIGQPEPGGAGIGMPAQPVADDDGPFDFTGFDRVEISASGEIRDLNLIYTGPGGADDPVHRYPFRGALVYSLIGIWSAEPDGIVPLGPFDPTPVFDIGAAAVVPVPTVPSAYLFLGENDGIFADNVGAYDVRLEAIVAPVPTPAALPLFAAAAAAVATRARRRAASPAR